jgi:hypothetical protein
MIGPLGPERSRGEKQSHSCFRIISVALAMTKREYVFASLPADRQVHRPAEIASSQAARGQAVKQRHIRQKAQ